MSDEWQFNLGWRGRGCRAMKVVLVVIEDKHQSQIAALLLY